jgi:hypothetical protein
MLELKQIGEYNNNFVEKDLRPIFNFTPGGKL